MDVDTEPPMEGPGAGPQLYCKPIGVDADDASDGDGADASESRSDAGEPRLILGSHRALDAIGGFVPPTDLRALSVVSKTAWDSRVLVAIKRVVTQRWTACAASMDVEARPGHWLAVTQRAGALQIGRRRHAQGREEASPQVG